MVLYAGHGTPGARHALRCALKLAEQQQMTLHHLLIVAEFWGDMLGDDWLNNARTRAEFGHYLEDRLAHEAKENMHQVETACRQHGVRYHPLLRQGDPTTCLIESAQALQPRWVVIGAPRPKGVAGLRDRLDLTTLAQRLVCPLVVVPPGS